MARKFFYKEKYNNFFEESLINLTPLIDVVFVVLIAFIIIAPLLEVDKVVLASGKEVKINQKDLAHTSVINIYVKEDNSIWLNQERVDEITLVKKLEEKRAFYPQQTPKLFHDKKAYFGTYQMVKNATEKAGFTELDVILKSK